MLNNYFKEIISKSEWDEIHEPFKRDIQIKNYRKALKVFHDKIFKRGQREIFLRNNTKIRGSDVAKHWEVRSIASWFNDHSKYSMPMHRMGSLMILGRVLKGKKLVKISDALKEAKNREKASDKMEEKIHDLQAKEETEAIEKQISAIQQSIDDNNMASEIEVRYEEWRKDNKLDETDSNIIVITYDTRKVASMSTEKGGGQMRHWSSCMNLTDGEYRYKMPGTVDAGAFVAYYTTPDNQTELKEPLGRCAFKPYFGNKGDIIWKPSRIYGNPPSNFYSSLKKWIDKVNKPTDDYYLFNKDVYKEPDDNELIIINKSKTKEAQQAWNRYSSSYSTRYDSTSDLEAGEVERDPEDYVDAAWDAVREDFMEDPERYGVDEDEWLGEHLFEYIEADEQHTDQVNLIKAVNKHYGNILFNANDPEDTVSQLVYTNMQAKVTFEKDENDYWEWGKRYREITKTHDAKTMKLFDKEIPIEQEIEKMKKEHKINALVEDFAEFYEEDFLKGYHEHSDIKNVKKGDEYTIYETMKTIVNDARNALSGDWQDYLNNYWNDNADTFQDSVWETAADMANDW